MTGHPFLGQLLAGFSASKESYKRQQQPKRLSYTKTFKAQIIQECAQPDASIASVA
jgi:transposase-like protein